MIVNILLLIFSIVGCAYGSENGNISDLRKAKPKQAQMVRSVNQQFNHFETIAEQEQRFREIARQRRLNDMAVTAQFHCCLLCMVATPAIICCMACCANQNKKFQ